MSTEYARFSKHAREIGDIGAALALLSWDQEVFLPAKGIPSRARHKATLAAIHHDRVVSVELGELIDTLQGRTPSDIEAANLREMKRIRDRAVKIPKRLVVELTETGSLAQPGHRTRLREGRRIHRQCGDHGAERCGRRLEQRQVVLLPEDDITKVNRLRHAVGPGRRQSITGAPPTGALRSPQAVPSDMYQNR